MNSTSSNPSDAEAIRRLLAESGIEETPELSDALTHLRAEARRPAPVPSPELAAFFTPGVTPLRKSRRRGYLLGGAIIAAMAAGTTGVAASNGGLWVTAEDAHDAPAPAQFEQVPAPAPVPVPEPAETDPAALPPVLPPEPAEQVPEPAAPADTPAPAEPDPADSEQRAGKTPESGWGSPGGRSDRPGNGREPGREDKPRGWEKKDQDGPGQHGGKNDKGSGPGRSDDGKDRGGPQHGNGRGSD